MDNCFRPLVLAVALLFSGIVSAGYADLPPPPKYTTTTITINGVKSVGTILPAIGNTFETGKPLVVQTPINLGGGTTAQLPVGFKINMWSAAALVARAFTTNPLILAAATITSMSAPYIKQWLDNAHIKQDSPGVFKTNNGYHPFPSPSSTGMFCDYISAYGSYFAYFDWVNGGDQIQPWCVVTDKNSVTGQFYTRMFSRGYFPADRTLAWADSPDPMPIQDVSDRLSMIQLPEQVALDIGVPLPVADIVLNPDAAGQPQALRVPLSSPVAIPGSPNYSYSAIDVVPDPTVDNPWRVSLNPVTVTTSSSAPVPTAPLPITPGSGFQTSTIPPAVINPAGVTSTPNTTPIPTVPTTPAGVTPGTTTTGPAYGTTTTSTNPTTGVTTTTTTGASGSTTITFNPATGEKSITSTGNGSTPAPSTVGGTSTTTTDPTTGVTTTTNNGPVIGTTVTTTDPTTGVQTSVTTGPTGSTTTTFNPATGQKTTTNTGTGSTPAPLTQAELDLCILHPDILACSVLGGIPETTTPLVTEVPLTFAVDSGWGSGGGSCPAALHLKSGFGVEYTIKPICDFMSGLKPVVLAVAWLSAAFIILGFKGNT